MGGEVAAEGGGEGGEVCGCGAGGWDWGVEGGEWEWVRGGAERERCWRYGPDDGDAMAGEKLFAHGEDGRGLPHVSKKKELQVASFAGAPDRRSRSGRQSG